MNDEFIVPIEIGMTLYLLVLSIFFTFVGFGGVVQAFFDQSWMEPPDVALKIVSVFILAPIIGTIGGFLSINYFKKIINKQPNIILNKDGIKLNDIYCNDIIKYNNIDQFKYEKSPKGGYSFVIDLKENIKSLRYPFGTKQITIVYGQSRLDLPMCDAAQKAFGRFFNINIGIHS